MSNHLKQEDRSAKLFLGTCKNLYETEQRKR